MNFELEVSTYTETMADVLYDLAGNVTFLTLFAILLPPQLWFGYRHKTWGFTFGMICGLVLEVIGYVARVQMHHGEGRFAMYVTPETQPSSHS